ncbi:MAG: dihydrofolate reductase family protein [Desulfarculaceae bacterium]|nr:dihydrofolate reductase family protein [Desulfarculaceae bacterium]
MKVVLVMAMTVDGKISRNPLEPVDWTGREDKKAFVRITRDAGVVIMGARTFDTIRRPLPDRKNIVLTRDTTRTSDHPELIFTDQSPSKILEALEEERIDTAALIGGAVVNTLFLRENLIDEIYVTVAPRLFGQGLSMFNEAFDKKVTLVDLVRLDEEAVLLKYAVKPQISFPS